MSKKIKKNVIKVDLDKISSPEFLKTLSYDELDLLASDIRKKILESTSNNGGHLSSNLCSVELTIALHRIFDFKNDKLIFDVGHQCYTHKILTGRKLDTLRQQDGISGFQKRSESVYDCFEAGHSSTSISAANGFAITRDLNKEDYNVIAFCGDSSFASGMSFEALNNIGRSNHKVIVLLNDNGMSISKPVGGLSKFFANISSSKGYNRAKTRFSNFMNKTKFGKLLYKSAFQFKNWIKQFLIGGNVFNALGFAYIGPVDGHNIKKIEKALLRAKNTKKSVIIHACTTKGKGYKIAEEDETGYWHGVSPFDIETGKQKNEDTTKISWSCLFAKLTAEMIEKHNNAVIISPATLKGSELDLIDKKYSSRIFDVGISEEHAVTLASAISLNGYHPIISIYSTFMQRSYDQISHDIARMNCNATFLVDRAGLVGRDGETHQGIYDEGYVYTIPNTVITMPSNSSEAKNLYEESFNNHGPFFIRISRNLMSKDEQTRSIDVTFGKWLFLNESSNEKVLIGVGPLLRELADKINILDIKISIVNALYIKPLDEECLEKLLSYQTIYLYDPYSTEYGLIDAVKAFLIDHNYKGIVKSFSVKNDFIKQGSINQQLEKLNLTIDKIIKEIKN